MYLSRRSAPVQKQREEAMFSEDKRNVNSNRNGELIKGKRYSVKMKQEIGEYASKHSVKDTAVHFTEKLQTPVKERTVRRFYKMYLDKCQSQNRSHEVTIEDVQVMDPQNCGNQETVHVNVYSAFPETQNNPVTLYQLNQPPTNNIGYQTAASASVITSQSNYQTLQNFSSSIPAVSIPTAPPAYPIALINPRLNCDKSSMVNISVQSDNQQHQTCLVPQHSLILTHQDRGSPLLPHFLAAQPLQPTILTLISDKGPQKVEEGPGLLGGNEMQTSFTSECYQESDPIGTELMTQEKPEIVEKFESKSSESSDVEQLPETKKRNRKRPTKKKDKGSKKRGTYTSYSPEIRAEIGKFAAEHGSLKACQHFANILGHDVPESTARGLREKYLLKKKHCQVTSLGYSQRGRPLRLGRYDELVQECIKDLVRSGEKVSSFLAITTAKEILNKYEPGLLEENGGSLKLNITWAKSFLKRIGVHNNS